MFGLFNRLFGHPTTPAPTVLNIKELEPEVLLLGEWYELPDLVAAVENDCCNTGCGFTPITIRAECYYDGQSDGLGYRLVCD